LVTYRDGLPACRQSPIQVLTRPSVEQLQNANDITDCHPQLSCVSSTIRVHISTVQLHLVLHGVVGVNWLWMPGGIKPTNSQQSVMWLWDTSYCWCHAVIES